MDLIILFGLIIGGVASLIYSINYDHGFNNKWVFIWTAFLCWFIVSKYNLKPIVNKYEFSNVEIDGKFSHQVVDNVNITELTGSIGDPETQLLEVIQYENWSYGIYNIMVKNKSFKFVKKDIK